MAVIMTGKIQSIVLQRSLKLKEETSDLIDIFSISFCHNNINHKRIALQKTHYLTDEERLKS